MSKPDYAAHVVDCPEMDDLMDKLRFEPDKGRIWLGDARMLLVHAEAFGAFRRDLIETLGFNAARQLITRFGYMSGAQDAHLARHIRKDMTPWEQFTAGPHLHAIEGYLFSIPLFNETFNAERAYKGEVQWQDSAEANAHIDAFGIGSMPACWMEAGYASGFMSSFFGRSMLVRETQCRAMGHENCVSIAKPLEEWDDLEKDYLYPVPSIYDLPAHSPKDQTHSFSPKPRKKDEPVGSSSAFNTVMHRIERVAKTTASVLFLGESGVGKSLLARQIHKKSPRADQPFIEVNCAAIPDQLIEAELFGVEKGAYTGASDTRAGRFEVAHGGSIFLDEIALLTPTAQSKLLRILQTGEMEYLGSTKTRKVDVRVIAATNENLTTAIKDGRFREDLFYRLNVFPIAIPPLRERRDDLPDLIEMCLQKFAERHNRNIPGITARALQDMMDYPWPGNVRELENIIERAMILCEDGALLDTFHLYAYQDNPQAEHTGGLTEQPLKMLKTPKDSGVLPAPVTSRTSLSVEDVSQALLSKAFSLEDIQEHLAAQAIARCNGNITKAADLIGMSRAQLAYRLKKTGQQ